MTAMTMIDRYHRYIMATLVLVILAMLTACTLNDAIPICHWLFGCDHAFHAGLTP